MGPNIAPPASPKIAPGTNKAPDAERLRVDVVTVQRDPERRSDERQREEPARDGAR
jgi:hypothetical protein